MMIHIEVNNKVDTEVFINIFPNSIITSIEEDSKVCKIYFLNCRFSKSESDVDLKIYFASNFVVH